MSSQNDVVADGSTSARQTAPYTFVNLVRNVALSEDESGSQDVTITCVEFWNDNLYIGTSDGEVLHHVVLPPASEDEQEVPTFILASRLRPDFATAAPQSGVQRVVILPDAGKACVLCNGTLTFYSLPELSPAYGESIKVNKCTWISAVQHDVGGAGRSEDGSLVMICVDRRVQLIRVGERPKGVRKIELGGCVKAACSSEIACVANGRSYSLLDIVEQQQIPLFEVNPQATAEAADDTEKPLPSLPSGTEREEGAAARPQDSQNEAVTLPPEQLSETGIEAAHPPRSSSLETRLKVPSQTRQIKAKGADLLPHVLISSPEEFLLTTGTSVDEPGVGIFVNHDGDVVRGTIQFSSYPEDLIIDSSPRQKDAATLESRTTAGFSGQANVLAIVQKTNGVTNHKVIEVISLSEDADAESDSKSLDIRECIPEATDSFSLGIAQTLSYQEVGIPEVHRIFEKVIIHLSASSLPSNTESAQSSSPDGDNDEQSRFVQRLSRIESRSLMWTGNSVYWIVRAASISQLDSQLDQAMASVNADAAGFVDRHKVESLLSQIRAQEDSADELQFVSNRYSCQKASLLLFFDLAVQTAAGAMTYDRDRQLTEHALAEGDVDPRILIASLAALRSDLDGKTGTIRLQSGLFKAWISFRESRAADVELDPHKQSWENLLQLIKRYLMRWRRKKGYGSVSSDEGLFKAVDLALLRLLLILDAKHPRGRALKGSTRSELNALVDEGVDCFDEAVEILEQQQRLYIISRLYQGRRQYAKVLDTWKRIVEGEDDAGGELGNGEEEIRDYLTKRKDKALIEEYGTWLAARNPKVGVRVFSDPKSQLRFEPQDVVRMLEGKAPGAVKEYLEELVFGNNLSQYANDLIGYYLDSVLEELQSSETARESLSTSYETYRALTLPKPAYSQFAADNSIDASWWRNRLRLLQLLGGSHSAASQYDTEAILDRTEPYKDLLVPETIILSGRRGRHEEAIRLLTHGLGDFDTAVSYCVLGGGSTYSQPDQSQRALPSHEEQAELFTDLLKEFLRIDDLNARITQTGELLGRFSRWFTIEDIIATVPEDWSVDRISSFFENALRSLQSERAESLILRALTSSQNLTSSAQVVEKTETLGAVLQREMDGATAAG